ncbi:MAG: hypothetical protein PVG78_16475 [Desulfobacterales bacterium]|jgi:hypothetical protein
MERIEAFLDRWTEDPLETKPVFRSLLETGLSLPGARFEFHQRPGISYSLRLMHENQTDRPLFAMIDVIDDDPSQRWLSVCFYDDMIQDPEQMGDLVPGGLLGSDGYCFDIAGSDGSIRDYVGERILEAGDAASAAH